MAIIAEPYLFDANTIEEIEMSESWSLPGQTKRVSFRIKNLAGDLTQADTISVVICDPADSSRVLYDPDNLSNTGTGIYMYVFTVPVNVIEGDWYVAIAAVLEDDTETTKRNVHFDVRKR